MTRIDAVWQEVNNTPFPVNVLADAVALDLRAKHCVDAFLTGGGALTGRERRKLDACLVEMRQMNPNLVGDAQVYFGKLYRLCSLMDS